MHFNGAVATATAWSASSISVNVPGGATSGPVSVSVGGQQSNGLPFTVGATPSTTTVAITDPFAGTTFNGPSSVQVAASVFTPGPSISRVEFYDGQLLIGTDSAPPYAVTWPSPLLGSHSLTAVAVDQLATTTSSTPADVIIGPAGGTLGTLGTPRATPAGGAYLPGQSITLTPPRARLAATRRTAQFPIRRPRLTAGR